MHSYPKDLARLVRRQWNKPCDMASLIEPPTYKTADKLPPLPVLNELLSTCYHASLLRDENRPVRFRVILREPGRFIEGPASANNLNVLPFERPFPLEPHELRRLAPASPLEQSLIGVRLSDQSQLEIWGLVHSGEQWVRVLEGLRHTFEPLPASLVASVVAPGHLTVAKGSLTVARLLSGYLATPTPGVLEISDVRPAITALENRLVTILEAERAKSGGRWARIDLPLVKRVRRLVALRVASDIRRQEHGATVLMLPPDIASDPKNYAPVLRIKYSFERGPSRLRLSQLTLRLLKELALACAARSGPDYQVTWQDYLSSQDPAVLQADEAISEFSKYIARLSSVDGAVVIGQPLELLGFGAEISGSLPQVDSVSRALDSQFTRLERESTWNVGTRHRSAYRFCQALPGASALVVSQDGSTRFIACLEGQVVYSEQLSSGALNL